MIRRLPIVPTIIVLVAAGVMVWLGFWQLGRADEKAELIQLSQAALENGDEVEFPVSGDAREKWFRRSAVNCQKVIRIEAVAGTSAQGEKGWVFRASCSNSSADAAFLVDIGFSRSLKTPAWDGGEVAGVIAEGPRLVADPAVAGLYALASPDPKDLPNNHLAYAGQWFFFALTALVIYFFAVRSRIKSRK